VNVVPRNARAISRGERRRKLQKALRQLQKVTRASSEHDAIAQKFPLARRRSSPISSANEIFPPHPVDLFFTPMSFFS
jgi:hypothetical protein